MVHRIDISTWLHRNPGSWPSRLCAANSRNIDSLASEELECGLCALDAQVDLTVGVIE